MQPSCYHHLLLSPDCCHSFYPNLHWCRSIPTQEHIARRLWAKFNMSDNCFHRYVEIRLFFRLEHINLCWYDCKTFTTQTFTTPDVHHPQCKIRRSPPQTFTTPSVKSDVHHPQCKIRRSPPQTFTTSDVHHPLLNSTFQISPNFHY